MSPLKGIQACILHPNEHQRITLYEALKLFTVNGAYIGFEEHLKGSIEPGKDADLVILSGDPLKLKTWVETTIVNGNVVYEREKDTKLRGLLAPKAE